jgi:hypothetical protein
VPVRGRACSASVVTSAPHPPASAHGAGLPVVERIVTRIGRAGRRNLPAGRAATYAVDILLPPLCAEPTTVALAPGPVARERP